jgi:hypothetical protein
MAGNMTISYGIVKLGKSHSYLHALVTKHMLGCTQKRHLHIDSYPASHPAMNMIAMSSPPVGVTWVGWEGRVVVQAQVQEGEVGGVKVGA